MRKIYAAMMIALFGSAANAQPVNLQEYEVPADHGPQKVIVQVGEIPGGAKAAWHTHHGAEIGRLESGELDIITPDGTRRLHPGDSFQIPRGTPHSAANPGTVTARIVAIMVVDRDAPLREPASPPAAK